jgi:hypothetical protein
VALTNDSTSYTNIFLLRLDAAGNAWVRQYGNNGATADSVSSIAMDASGSIVMSGNFTGTTTFGSFSLIPQGTGDLYIQKVNSAGTVLWAKRYGGTSAEYLFPIALDNSGNVFIVGYFNGTVDLDGLSLTASSAVVAGYEVFFFKLDGNGIRQFVNQLNLSYFTPSIFPNVNGFTLSPSGTAALQGNITSAYLGAYRFGSKSVRGPYIYTWPSASPWVAVTEGASESVSFQSANGFANSGFQNVALGGGVSTGYGSVALGLGTKANSSGSVALGSYTTSSGSASFATGQSTLSSGSTSTALGSGTWASGQSSLATGTSTRATGNGATAFGEQTIAQAYDSLVLGRYNIAQGTTTSWVATDDLFVIGNGTADTARANAYVVKKNGDANLAGRISATGGSASGNLSTAIGGLSVASGEKSMALGYENTVTGELSYALGWHNEASGQYSTSIGIWNRSQGRGTTSLGEWTWADGWIATALGHVTRASGSESTAFGAYTTASATYATAMGNGTIASGLAATATGQSTVAQSQNEFVVGRFNVAQGSTNTWVTTDNLFTVGNGSSDTARSNAFVIKKNGDSNLSGVLSVTGSVRVPSSGDLSMGEFTSGQAP